MTIDISKITCENSRHVNRHCDGCDYVHNGQFLFYERSCFPHNIYKESSHTQWFCQFNLTKAECDQIVQPYGEKIAASCEHFYNEGVYFPIFKDNDKAIEFCQTDIFDKLSKSLDKV